ncbi:MAG: hypothetical protein JJU35_08320 [Balneolales bacterium]|nr:hypothetical protein [Balneolales bacterium]
MNKNILIILAGLLIGGLTGFSYWYFIGCDTGTCAITSNWSTSTLYGLGMGGLGASIVKDSIASRKAKKEQQLNQTENPA